MPDEFSQSDSSRNACRTRLFISYGRHDAGELARRLSTDLEAAGYEVWLDQREILGGSDWQHVVVDGLRSTQIVVALLSPHAVRVGADSNNPDASDSVCLDELTFARFAQPPIPIVPVMAVACEPPFCIYRLHYVEMCAWQDSEDVYRRGFAELSEAVEAAIQRKVRFRRFSHDLHPWDFAALLNEKRRGFVGREWLLDAIDAWRTASGSERALLITGDPGVGKSAIVAQLVHCNPNGQVLAYHCCLADTPETLRAARFVRSIAAIIASRISNYARQLESAELRDVLSQTSCEKDPASAFEQGVLAPLEQLPAPSSGPRYILVDGLDEALLLGSGTTIVDLLASRLNRFPGWVRLVATSRKEPDVLKRLSGLRSQTIDADDPRNLEDVDRYILARLGTPNLAERLAAAGLSPGAVRDTLMRRSDGNFLYLRQALDGLETDQYGFAELERLPPGLFGLYFEFFRRHFADAESFEQPRRLLEVVVAMREPLTKEQLAAASGLKARSELPQVLRCLHVYLRPRPDETGIERYSLFHKSLADWLTNPEQEGDAYFIDAQSGDERLATWCWKQYEDGVENMSAYALRQLVRHLVNADRWDDLRQLLTDLSYIESRARAGSIFDLVIDYDGALDAHPELAHERRRQHERIAHLRRYAEELVSSVRNGTTLPEAPDSDNTRRQIRQTVERRRLAQPHVDKMGDAEQIRMFATFLSTNAHAIRPVFPPVSHRQAVAANRHRASLHPANRHRVVRAVALHRKPAQRRRVVQSPAVLLGHDSLSPRAVLGGVGRTSRGSRTLLRGAGRLARDRHRSHSRSGPVADAKPIRRASSAGCYVSTFEPEHDMTRLNRFLFDEATAAFCERNGRVIVEIGGIRNRGWPDTDGHSTLRWPADATVWSIDTDPAAVKLTRELAADRTNVFCVLADALAFLRAFPIRIDLLYLDGLHPDREDGRRWHFDAFQAAPMNHRGVVLIDDTDLPRLGKAEFVVPMALEDGFQVVASDRQTLLVR